MYMCVYMLFLYIQKHCCPEEGQTNKCSIYETNKHQTHKCNPEEGRPWKREHTFIYSCSPEERTP